jgi:hypothetical protein
MHMTPRLAQQREDRATNRIGVSRNNAQNTAVACPAPFMTDCLFYTTHPTLPNSAVSVIIWIGATLPALAAIAFHHCNGWLAIRAGFLVITT